METIQPMRSVEEAVSYSIAHRTRIEVLCALNEGTYTTAGLSERLNLPISTISHHIKELLKAGSIELAKVEKVRNIDQHFYRAIELPLVTDEEASTLPPEVKQQYAAAILQAIMAEGLGALWAEKLNRDPLVRMMWRWYNLDRQGREELAQEQLESWERMTGIEARSANRCAETGETPKTMIAVTMGFERSKSAMAEGAAVRRLAPREPSDR